MKVEVSPQECELNNREEMRSSKAMPCIYRAGCNNAENCNRAGHCTSADAEAMDFAEGKIQTPEQRPSKERAARDALFDEWSTDSSSADDYELWLEREVLRLRAPSEPAARYTMEHIAHALRRSLYAKTGNLAIEGIIKDLAAALPNGGDHPKRNGCPDLDPDWPNLLGQPRGPRLCVLYPNCKCGDEDKRASVPPAESRLTDAACEAIIEALESCEFTGFTRGDIRLIATTIEAHRLAPTKESRRYQCMGCGKDVAECACKKSTHYDTAGNFARSVTHAADCGCKACTAGEKSAPSDPLADVRWICSSCNTSNGHDRSTCIACSSAHGKSVAAQGKSDAS